MIVEFGLIFVLFGYLLELCVSFILIGIGG